jgi:prepilin-type N-terminal cleavage/methylation domain-containing protein
MPGREDKAFTLLEVLLAIAVIALIVTGIIGISSHLLAARAASPDDIFWQACAAARKMALESGAETRLGFDDKTKAFVIGNGLSSKNMAVPSARDDLSVNFLTTQGGASSVLIGGALVETQTITYVTFYPDGTCTPFRLQIRQRDNVRALNIDPWTCARVLSGADSNASGSL